MRGRIGDGIAVPAGPPGNLNDSMSTTLIPGTPCHEPAGQPIASKSKADAPVRVAQTGLWLRRADQAALGAVVLLSLVSLAGYWWSRGLGRGELIEIEHAEPLTATFLVDINRATWPELATLPGIGETIARAIVSRREEQGPFRALDDLLQVRRIGPATLARIRPHLMEIPPDTADDAAGNAAGDSEAASNPGDPNNRQL
jgi:competence protein ComEA